MGRHPGVQRRSQRNDTDHPAEDRLEALSRVESRQLRALLAVVRHESFTAAAESLNLTQPALSRSVQMLEDRLGVRLIERTPKSFQLTKFGRIVVDRAMAIERQSAQILDEIEALKTGAEGALSLGVGPSAISFLAPAIQAFQEVRPNLLIRVLVNSMEENYDALLNGDLDVICTALNFPDHRRLVTEEFGEVENAVFARADHPLSGSGPVSIDALADYPWIFFNNDRMGYERVAGYFAARDVKPPAPAIETNALDTLFTLLATGSYLASVPSIVEPEARRAGLAPITIEGGFWSIPIGIAYLRSIHPPPAVTALTAALRRHFRSSALL
jgi:LysR family transcriptional regulator of abg operon